MRILWNAIRSMTIVWDGRYIAFSQALPAIRTAGEASGLAARLVGLVHEQTPTESVVLLRLVEGPSVAVIAAAPADSAGPADDPDSLRRLIAAGEIVVGPVGPEAPGVPGRVPVSLPVSINRFQGLFRLMVPAALGTDPGFREYLERIRTLLDGEIRLGQFEAQFHDLGSRFASILATIPQAVLCIGAGDERSWMNAKAAGQLGLPADCQATAAIAQALGRLWSSATNAAENEGVAAALAAAPDRSIRGWKWYFGEPLERVLEVGSSPIDPASDVGRLWVLSDVTAQYRVGATLARLDGKLTRSEVQFRTAFDDSATGMVLIGPDRRFFRVNRAFCELLGVSAQELRTRTLQDVTPPEHHDRSARIEHQLWEEPASRIHVETPFRHRDGRTVWTMLGASIVRDEQGQPQYAIAQVQDITDRREAEASLKEQENLLRLILENLPAPVCVKDREGRYSRVNRAFAERQGKPIDAIVGLTDFELFPEFAERNRRLDAAALASEGPIEREVETSTVLGQRSVILRGSRLLDAEGEPTGTLCVVTDITERKQAEIELSRGRERYRAVVNDLTDMVARYGTDGRLNFLNDAYCAFFGMSREHLMEHGWEPVIHPEDRARVVAEVASLGPENPTVRVTNRVIDAQGRTRWVEFINRALLDSDGRVTEYQGVGRDVTSRREHLQQLQAMNARLKLAIDASDMGIWCWNLADNSVEWDERLREWYDIPADMPPSEITYQLWCSKVHPEDLARCEAAMASSQPGGPPIVMEFRILSPDGRVRSVLSSSVLELDLEGRPIRMVGMNRDITPQRIFEERLNETNKRLELATQAGGIGTWTWNFADDSVAWDHRLIDWFGVPDPVLRRGALSEFWQSRVHPEDLAGAEAAFAESRAGGVPLEHAMRLLRADGVYRMVQTSALLDHDPDGRPTRLIGIDRDVTDQRELEAILESARQQAEAASRAKTAFLAHMSHEIRTPAGAVLGYADMLLDPSLPPEASVAAAQSIRRNGTHLLAILDDVLDLAKIESGKLALEQIAYPPWQVMLEMNSLLSVSASERQIQLVCRPASSLPEQVLMDPTRLRQVLINLVGNALKFSESGRRVDVTIAATPGTGAEPGELTLVVEDQGIGMTAEQIGRLFRPFEQADSSTTRRFGGSGLGLSIARGHVDLMGGTIAVQSTPEVGSRFTVRIPLRLPDRPDLAWVAPEDLDVTRVIDELQIRGGTPRGIRGRVLLVDDCEDNRRVIRYYLGQLGLDQVDVATDGRAAVIAALRDRPDVVLMDMEMPELDGCAATRALRRSGYDRPIVALTAHAMQHDRERSIEAGCDEHLTKPVDRQALAVTLARFLSDPGSRPAAEALAEPGDPITPDFGGDPAFLELVREYAAGLPAEFADVSRALQRGDLARVAERAHKLRGSGGMYGLECLSESAGRLETAIRGGEGLERVTALTGEFLALLPRIERGLADLG